MAASPNATVELVVPISLDADHAAATNSSAPNSVRDAVAHRYDNVSALAPVLAYLRDIARIDLDAQWTRFTLLAERTVSASAIARSCSRDKIEVLLPPKQLPHCTSNGIKAAGGAALRLNSRTPCELAIIALLNSKYSVAIARHSHVCAGHQLPQLMRLRRPARAYAAHARTSTDALLPAPGLAAHWVGQCRVINAGPRRARCATENRHMRPWQVEPRSKPKRRTFQHGRTWPHMACTAFTSTAQVPRIRRRAQGFRPVDMIVVSQYRSMGCISY
jgi:hypothetical protein